MISTIIFRKISHEKDEYCFEKDKKLNECKSFENVKEYLSKFNENVLTKTILTCCES